MLSSWTIVVPVKGTSAAKSRLGGNDRLAMAMALDTVEAALAVAPVIVVTSAAARAAFEQLGARVVSDPGTGLIGAISAGLAGAPGATAVLLGDLPAVRPAELAAALDAAARHPLSIVADADATGTALAAATPGAAHALAFGPGSRAAHVAAGYVELAGEWPGLRRDIDLAEHLDGLTLGPRTAAVLRGHRGD